MTRTRRAIGAGLVGTVCLVTVVEVCLAPPPVPRQPGTAAPRARRSASRPALPRVTSRPAAERDAVLKRIEQRAKEVATIAADFVQHTYAPVFDGHDTRTGSLKLLKPQFLRVDWKTPAPPEAIVYDGEFLYEIKHGTKQIIKWTVAKKRPAGQGKAKLDIGPLRFLAGIKADELKKDYLIALVDAPKDKQTYHFLLVPLKPGEYAQYKRLDVWIDRKALLPVKVRSHKKAREVETWTLKNLQVNKGVVKGDFRVKVPRGWKLITDPA